MNFRERLGDTDDVLVMFTAIQTLLVEEYGKSMEQHLSEWVVAHPGKFQDAIKRACAAGCDLIPTATQAASPFRSRPFGQAVVAKVYELNYRSAKIAKEITPEGHYVCGVISSSNPDWLEPVGNMTYEEVYQGYKEQVLGLAEGGVDLFLVVGNHIDESIIAIKVIRDLTDIPIIGANVFYAGKKGFRTMTGLDPKSASAKLRETGVDVIGAACGLMSKSADTAEWYPAATILVKEMREGTDGYLLIAPDAGLAQLIDEQTVYPASPGEMANDVPNWIDAGARIVGGCCGTSLKHFQRVSVVMRESQVNGS